MIDLPFEIDELNRLSTWIGSDRKQVQGPGGNTSFKNHEYMWVKASGTQLKDAEKKNIFVKVNQSTGKLAPENQILRPSIETILHRSINAPFVAHTHSSSAIYLGFKMMSGVDYNYLNRVKFIPYCRPGENLANALSSSININEHDFAILGNHGLLTWGKSALEIKEKITYFETIAKDFYQPDAANIAQARDILMNGDVDKYLTPDHAVFLTENELAHIGNIQGTWQIEMLEELVDILSSIVNSKCSPWLSVDEVLELRNWDAEKLRRAAGK